jgi:hypothetical protein
MGVFQALPGALVMAVVAELPQSSSLTPRTLLRVAVVAQVAITMAPVHVTLIIPVSHILLHSRPVLHPEAMEPRLVCPMAQVLVVVVPV